MTTVGISATMVDAMIWFHYQNDLTEKGADPSAIYVTEGEEQGYYYLYSTSDPIGATGYLCYRSKNLNDCPKSSVSL